MTKDELKRLPFVVVAYQKIYPTESCCGICNLPWSACGCKSVDLGNGEGTFAICPYCWERATLQEAIKVHTNTYINQCITLSDDSRQKFIECRPLDHVLECVQKEYNKTHNKQ